MRLFSSSIAYDQSAPGTPALRVPGNAKLLCFGEFGSRSRTGNDVVGVAAHAAADIGATRANELLRFCAGHCLERAGKNECFAR